MASSALAQKPEGKVTIEGFGTHESIDASTCIAVRIESIPKDSKNFLVFVENRCGIRFLVVTVNLKYIDKEGYRIGSDSDGSGVTIPSFAVNEKVKKKMAFPLAEAVGAQLREVNAIK